MAKQPVGKNATSRIRFIMLEAEIPEGDLSQITSAIQNALKPATTVIQQRLVSTPASPASQQDESEDEDFILGDDPQTEVPAQQQTREPRVRKPTSMKVLEVNLDSEPSFQGFVERHAPKNDTERNLVALAWFKEHRPNEVVTPNHVYTCYRKLNWPSGIDDFPSILRSLKRRQLVKSVGRGAYEINHLGIDLVRKMEPSI